MQLQELFNKQYDITEEVLSDTQKDSAFFVSCSIFFGEVDIMIPTVLYDDTTMNIVQEWEEFYAVVPKSYDNFDLPIKYHSDFLMVCENVILTTSLKNLNMLKNVGIEESIQQVPIDYQAIRELLRTRHNIGLNSYVE